MEIYRGFAEIYDIFMEDMPYSSWADFIAETLESHGIKKGSIILDMACGTGKMTFLLADKGYDMIGADISVDMLSEAYKKLAGRPIIFLNQDMRELDLYGTIDAACCTCDSINYLTKEEDVRLAFKSVSLFLNPGGIFIFDLKTAANYKKMGNETYYDERGSMSYEWINSFDAETGINKYEVQFFLPGETFSETHIQRAYDIKTIEKLTKSANLEIINVFDEYTCKAADEDCKRYTFVCKKSFS